MSENQQSKSSDEKAISPRPKRSRRKLRRRAIVLGIWTATLAIVVLGVASWVGLKAADVKSELQAATALLPSLKKELAGNDAVAATATVESLVEHTQAARDAANDPVWKATALLPWVGPNLQAAAEVAISADDVARLGAAPLVRAFQSLDWKSLAPSAEGMDLAPLQTAGPKVQSAAHAVRESSRRLNNIETENLLPQVSEPLIDARDQLSALQKDLDSAADAARIAPVLLGAESPKRYLLLVQNNAESRATGGIPGALAVLHVDKGHLKLESQTSATALGSFVPPVQIDAEQQAIYTPRVGRFMQDVNLTPDFPTTAKTARTMWEKNSGEQLDGVLSLDPVALSFILEATGPVEITDPIVQQIGSSLPSQLNSKNVVQTLLSDAYAKIEEPKLQDVYFAAAAKEIFGALSSGKTDPKQLMDALSKGVEEHRILLWSNSTAEQETLGRYPLGGMISGPAISPAQFGIYFNDGTGAKMDYWMKRTVQVVKDCTRDGYREVAVKVTSTNTAPTDAATSLPTYVTGDGAFGVPAGAVQTNVVAYGPVQANIDTVVRDGVKIPFAAQQHSQRGVGSTTIRLGPGESTTLEFNFGHIVQHSEPEIAVTPTTQRVKDVVLTARASACE
ncbi:conserved hypothetical protein [Arthrobacter sp. 9V]|uniref:DUF4012 domain-containing protein n=1 Tax=Arthrobacter sp. 9V TaxID=2653132 RepID=UPI0012F0575A|nr:DUF4012 domain-containing protein [Arthrobacter sp. 9V]VXC66377.1 conserved hypothetical protein [Arthrobacter sp. 9V]